MLKIQAKSWVRMILVFGFFNSILAFSQTYQVADGKLPIGQHKIILIHFWATWCKPCLLEIPSLNELYSKLDPKKVLFMAVSIDKDIEALKTTIKIYKPKFPIYSDPTSQLAKKFGTVKVPETFILDSNGKTLDKIIGSREWGDSVYTNYLHLLFKEKVHK